MACGLSIEDKLQIVFMAPLKPYREGQRCSLWSLILQETQEQHSKNATPYSSSLPCTWYDLSLSTNQPFHNTR